MNAHLVLGNEALDFIIDLLCAIVDGRQAVLALSILDDSSHVGLRIKETVEKRSQQRIISNATESRCCAS